MAIQSESEFEAVISGVLRQLEKISYSQAGDPKLDKARRQLQIVLDVMLDDSKDRPTAEQLRGLTEAAEAIRSLGLGDPKLEEKSFDIEDYVTYRM
jgi:hypothetical protein